jgi:hypothetical protein
MPSRWRRARDRLTTPESIAYHEAAHAVVAYRLGWWVRRGGVRIGAWPHVRLQHQQGDDNVRAQICIRMAGLLAEQKFHQVQWRFEEDIIKEVVAIRAGRREELELFRSDLRNIALALVDDDPPIRLSEARRAIVYWRDETITLLDEPRVWDGIVRVAKVLVRRRHLSPRAVRHLLGDEFFVPERRSNEGRADIKSLASASVRLDLAGAWTASKKEPPWG